MKVIQISVFLENKEGRLHKVCQLLGDNNINIRALSIAENEDFGILRIVVNNPQKAVEILKQNNIMANMTDIVAVEVDDQPGGLSKILNVLKDNDINVEYMYGFLERCSDKALLVFRFDHADKAIDILAENNIKVARENDINNL